MKQYKTYKLKLIGDIAVGKTSLIRRFDSDQFETNEITLGCPLYEKKVVVKDQFINLEIWDTGGQEKYRAIGPIFYKNTSAAIIVFDVTNKDSFISLKDWINQVDSHGPKQALKIIVGNKIDLQKNDTISQEAQKFAQQINIPLVFTSCKNGVGVKELFNQVAELLVEQK
ncbi:hypothetical protein pb186bvf_006054 [Paramecium bursaria]